jgi:hypothetical protein
VELVAEKEPPVRQHDRRRIADVLPFRRMLHRLKRLFDRVVDGAQVGQREIAARIVLATLNQHAPVGEHLRRIGRRRIARLQAAHLFPGAVHITAGLVGREHPEIGIAATLDKDGSVRQQIGFLRAVRRLIVQLRDGVGKGKSGQRHDSRGCEKTMKHGRKTSFCVLNPAPWPERRWDHTCPCRVTGGHSLERGRTLPFPLPQQDGVQEAKCVAQR